jgi:glycosyltransferase involved in cell wall biosynthesis
MKDKELVSIIITTKNEGRNILRLLVSIKGQTFNKLETIVVDNNSSDLTKEAALKFTPRVYNYGPERSAQRNYGTQISKGKYLLFLDADMELEPDVVADCLKVLKDKQVSMLTVPEKTVGGNGLAKIRNFEREMYMGDKTVEVPRFFKKDIFLEFGGYDEKLTGPEDYDLPYRISKKYASARSNQYILHHEEDLTLLKLLKKKYYYARKGALYAKKHPELILTQGNLLFRKAYFKNWKKFVIHPFLGLAFIFVRVLEMFSALAGFISSFIVLK